MKIRQQCELCQLNPGNAVQSDLRAFIEQSKIFFGWSYLWTQIFLEVSSNVTLNLRLGLKGYDLQYNIQKWHSSFFIQVDFFASFTIGDCVIGQWHSSDIIHRCIG